MKPISESIIFAISAVEAGTESPIESQLFWAMTHNPKFVLCTPEDVTEGAGYFLYPQYQICDYRVDFFIHARLYRTQPSRPGKFRDFKFIVEADGADYHSSAEQRARDKKRDAELLKLGYPTLRFTGSSIHKNSAYCVKQIIDYIKWNTR